MTPTELINAPSAAPAHFSTYCDRFTRIVVRCLLGGRASVSADERAESAGWFRSALAQSFPHGIARRGALDLAKLRRQAGLSQRELAARLGVGERCVRRWEAQHTIPRIEAARAVAAVFGLDPRDVVRLAGSRLDGGARRPRGYVAERGAIDKPLVGANLRALREAARLTQTQVAARCGVSRVMYSRYENGKEFPAMNHMLWRERVTAAVAAR